MSIRFEFNGRQMGARFKQAMDNQYGRIADASRDAATRAASEIKTKGDADILNAGNFGKRWTDSFNVRITPARGRTVNILVQAYSTISYFMIHERGGTITAKNPSGLLWIPLPWTGIKVRAKLYRDRLFRVDRQGKNPLLLSYADKEPKYVGVPSVRLRKRFHIGRIIRETVKNIPAYYRAAYRRRK